MDDITHQTPTPRVTFEEFKRDLEQRASQIQGGRGLLSALAPRRRSMSQRFADHIQEQFDSGADSISLDSLITAHIGNPKYVDRKKAKALLATARRQLRRQGLDTTSVQKAYFSRTKRILNEEDAKPYLAGSRGGPTAGVVFTREGTPNWIFRTAYRRSLRRSKAIYERWHGTQTPEYQKIIEEIQLLDETGKTWLQQQNGRTN